MQGTEKTKIIYLNDTALVTVKIRSVNMMDGWVDGKLKPYKVE